MSIFSPASRDAANAAVLARFSAVAPGWVAVGRADRALSVPDRCLLHAGPPLLDTRAIPAPLLSSAVLACMYEGWASNEVEAEILLNDARVRLLPAQDFGAVAPLAAVISPRSTVVEVADLARTSNRRAWSLLASGAGPQLRFGSRDPAILARLAWRDKTLAPALGSLLASGPIALGPFATDALEQGDELHAQCSAASAALHAHLAPRLVSLPEGEKIEATLAATPLFFLTLWMAACHLALDIAAADGRNADSTLVVGFGGNGLDCGIRIAGCPTRWWTAPATAPRGPFLNPSTDTSVAAMIGDSGAIDASGFGAHALTTANEQLCTAFAPYLPPDWATTSDQLYARIAGVGPFSAMLDSARIDVAHPARALIAMLDVNGRNGLLGRGVFTADPGPFVAATAFLTCNGDEQRG